MGLLDKAKAAAEQAAAKAKEGVEDVQTKRELAQTYTELGKTTYGLVDSGEISHPQLTALAEKIRELEAGAAAEPAMAGATTSSSTEPPASNQPPAMPT
jgi:poly-gamma-glutamate capsule biosynthesis protein CapA/YwtB (metallophosphatase superfamily)